MLTKSTKQEDFITGKRSNVGQTLVNNLVVKQLAQILYSLTAMPRICFCCLFFDVSLNRITPARIIATTIDALMAVIMIAVVFSTGVTVGMFVIVKVGDSEGFLEGLSEGLKLGRDVIGLNEGDIGGFKVGTGSVAGNVGLEVWVLPG